MAILLGKFEGGGSLVTDILIIAFIFQKEVKGMASQKYFQDKPIATTMLAQCLQQKELTICIGNKR